VCKIIEYHKRNYVYIGDILHSYSLIHNLNGDVVIFVLVLNIYQTWFCIWYAYFILQSFIQSLLP